MYRLGVAKCAGTNAIQGLMASPQRKTLIATWLHLRSAGCDAHTDPPAGIPATHKRAQWTAAAIFQRTPEGRIHTFYKDWDKLHMWRQLGWVPGEAPALE